MRENVKVGLLSIYLLTFGSTFLRSFLYPWRIWTTFLCIHTLDLFRPFKMRFSLLSSFTLLLPAIVRADNDWNTPCHSGSCQYNVENSTASHSTVGVLTIVSLQDILPRSSPHNHFQNGSTSAISDLTPAGGWHILDCDKDILAQDIRAVCIGSDSDCDHLWEKGAINTIVRLPEHVSAIFDTY